MLFHLLYGVLGDDARVPPRLPLPVDAHPRRGDHRAAAVVHHRAVVHRAAQGAPDRRDDPRRRPADPQEEGRHADDGRLADPVLPRGLDAAVVRPAQPSSCGSRSPSRSRSARSASPTTTRRSRRRTRRASPASCACSSSSRSPAPRWRTCSTRTLMPDDVRLHAPAAVHELLRAGPRCCRRGCTSTFGAFVVVGTANAVNLTDGLDGLAIGPSIMNAGTFLIFAYIAGVETTILGRGGAEVTIAQYLHVAHIDGVEELAIFGAALFGAGIGFLWYNTYPAQVFMGDVGSLGARRRDRHARRADQERARAADRRRPVRGRGAVSVIIQTSVVQGDQAVGATARSSASACSRWRRSTTTTRRRAGTSRRSSSGSGWSRALLALVALGTLKLR